MNHRDSTMAMLSAPLDKNLSLNCSASMATSGFGSSGDFTAGGWGDTSGTIKTNAVHTLGAYDFYQNHYYPYIVKESYPVYLQERALDKGKQAFEIIKVLQDKKLMKMTTAKEFIDAMDLLIKTL